MKKVGKGILRGGCSRYKIIKQLVAMRSPPSGMAERRGSGGGEARADLAVLGSVLCVPKYSSAKSLHAESLRFLPICSSELDVALLQVPSGIHFLKDPGLDYKDSKKNKRASLAYSPWCFLFL